MKSSQPPPSRERCPPSWLAEITAARPCAQSPPWPHSSAYADGVMLPAPHIPEQYPRVVVEGRDAAVVVAEEEEAVVLVAERWTGCFPPCRNFCR